MGQHVENQGNGSAQVERFVSRRTPEELVAAINLDKFVRQYGSMGKPFRLPPQASVPIMAQHERNLILRHNFQEAVAKGGIAVNQIGSKPIDTITRDDIEHVEQFIPFVEPEDGRIRTSQERKLGDYAWIVRALIAIKQVNAHLDVGPMGMQALEHFAQRENPQQDTQQAQEQATLAVADILAQVAAIDVAQGQVPATPVRSLLAASARDGIIKPAVLATETESIDKVAPPIASLPSVDIPHKSEDIEKPEVDNSLSYLVDGLSQLQHYAQQRLNTGGVGVWNPMVIGTSVGVGRLGFLRPDGTETDFAFGFGVNPVRWVMRRGDKNNTQPVIVTEPAQAPSNPSRALANPTGYHLRFVSGDGLFSLSHAIDLQHMIEHGVEDGLSERALLHQSILAVEKHVGGIEQRILRNLKRIDEEYAAKGQSMPTIELGSGKVVEFRFAEYNGRILPLRLQRESGVTDDQVDLLVQNNAFLQTSAQFNRDDEPLKGQGGLSGKRLDYITLAPMSENDNVRVIFNDYVRDYYAGNVRSRTLSNANLLPEEVRSDIDMTRIFNPSVQRRLSSALAEQGNTI